MGDSQEIKVVEDGGKPLFITASPYFSITLQNKRTKETPPPLAIKPQSVGRALLMIIGVDIWVVALNFWSSLTIIIDNNNYIILQVHKA